MRVYIDSIQRVLAFSTTTPLGANGVYTSPTIDTINYKVATFRALSDIAGSLVQQQSDDGVTWDTVSTLTVTANTPQISNGSIWLRYYRIVYTNGATLQTTFRLSTYLSPL